MMCPGAGLFVTTVSIRDIIGKADEEKKKTKKKKGKEGKQQMS
jgi:hypothetical protein